MMIDAKALKERINCQELLRSDLGEPKAIASGVWQWYCCFHDDQSGGSPSLTAWEDGWKCFSGSCNEHGDAITWVMKRKNVDFRTACEMLSGGNLDRYSSMDYKPEKIIRPLKTPAGTDWQSSAKAFVERCELKLWSKAGEKALDYLRKARGLSDASIKAWRLGYNDIERFDDIDRWPEAKKGDRKAVWLPRAIVLPHWQRKTDTMWAVKFRLPATDPSKRYRNIPGGQYDLYGADYLLGLRDAFLCEGEFDTILLWQELAGAADVFTFGSASVHKVAEWMPYLLPVQRLFVAMDNDPNSAGEKAAQEWLKTTQRAARVLPPGGAKDITDAWRAGYGLRAWAVQIVEFGADLQSAPF